MFRGLDIPREERQAIVIVAAVDAVWVVFAVVAALQITGVINLAFLDGEEGGLSPQGSALTIFGGMLIFCLNLFLSRRYNQGDTEFKLNVNFSAFVLANLVSMIAAIVLCALIYGSLGFQGIELLAVAVSLIPIGEFLLLTYIALRERRRELIRDGKELPDRELTDRERAERRKRLTMYVILAYDALWIVAMLVFGGGEVVPGWTRRFDLPSMAPTAMVRDTIWFNVVAYNSAVSGTKKGTAPFSEAEADRGYIVMLVATIVLMVIRRYADLPNRAWADMMLALPVVILVAYVSLRTLMWRGDKDEERGPWE